MAERITSGERFPEHLRCPQAYARHVGDDQAWTWHAARAKWLREQGLRGALTEIRAMTNPALSARLVADPDSSIGGPRRVPFRESPTQDD
jgi:hypothetical protein